MPPLVLIPPYRKTITGPRGKVFHLNGSLVNGLPNNTLSSITGNGSELWAYSTGIIESTAKPYASGTSKSIQFNSLVDTRRVLAQSPAIRDAFWMGDLDFTVSFWIRFNDIHEGGICGFNMMSGVRFGDWGFYVNNDNKMAFYSNPNKSGGADTLGWSTALNKLEGWSDVLTTNRWYYFEMSRVGSNWFCFQDGVLRKTFVSSAYIQRDDRFGFSLGAIVRSTWPTGAIEGNIMHNIAELEVWRGTGLHFSNYTPPTIPTTD